MASILVDGKKVKTAGNYQSEQIPVLVNTPWRNYMRYRNSSPLLTWQDIKCVGRRSSNTGKENGERKGKPFQHHFAQDLLT
jgi:hypothetical protein